MERKWSRILPPLLVLFAALMLSQLAFAKPHPHPVEAPEIDLRLAIQGLALAGGAAALIWEGIRRRRRK
jgi:hypothetical protein